ncbi:hypothetical protein [Proteiniborus sp. MB09-C3]|uniref:hypothetical protein n=1 Tax=Proteiniborus sp. MB09-C3 TaxID=3050072 RepID=UPI00332001D0
MNNNFVFFNSQFMRENEACIGVRNVAFNYGLACFEGIRAYWNEGKQQLYVFRMQDHFFRLLQSCKVLRIDIP